MSLLVGGHRGRSLCVLILLRYLNAAALIKRVTDMESRCAWEPMGKYFHILTLPQTLHLMACVSFYLIKYVHNTRYIC